MKRIVIIFVFVLCQYGLYAQTDVKGTFTQDTRWTIKDSPYNVIGNVGLPDGVTLTIDPGVVINFNTSYQIVVQGALKASGTMTEPIFMNGNKSGLAMIFFQKTNLSNSYLTYVNMQGSKNGIELGDFDNITNTGRLVINRLKLTNSCISALGTNTKAVVEINNSILINSRINNAVKDEAIVINNSKISDCHITAQSSLQPITMNGDTCYNTIFSSANSGSLEANSCLFYNSTFSLSGPLKANSCLFYNSTFSLSGSSEANSCHFYNSTFGLSGLLKANSCLFYNATFSLSGSFEANSCQFYNVKFIYGSYSVLTLKLSLLMNSSIDLWGSKVNMTGCLVQYNSDYKETYCIRAGTGLISSSEFIGNNSQTAISRARGEGSKDKFTVTNCEFKGFKTYLIVGEWNNNGNHYITIISHCNFLDSISDAAIINLSKYNMLANNNWWGTASESLIKNSIHDFWDDIIYGKVDYTDFLSRKIDKTDLLKIDTLYVTPVNANVLTPIRIITKTTLQAHCKRISRINYFYKDTLFIETCYSPGIGLNVTNVADTFDVGYLDLGNNPVVFKVNLSSSLTSCVQLYTKTYHTNLQINSPDMNFNKIASIPLKPLKGDHIKVATTLALGYTGYKLSKNHFIRNDTIFLQLKYVAVNSLLKLYSDTFDLGYLDYGNYVVVLSLGLSQKQDSSLSTPRAIIYSKLNVRLAETTNFKVTTLPKNPFSDEDITIYTEVRINQFGKLITNKHYIRNDTIFLEQCYYAGFGSQAETVKSSVNIGKLASNIYKIRFSVHLSGDSSVCKSSNIEMYDRILYVYPGLGFISTINKEVTLAPNPFNDLVIIKGKEIDMLEIYDLNGTLIKTYNRPNLNVIEGLSSLQTGLYIFQATLHDGMVFRKKMIKN